MPIKHSKKSSFMDSRAVDFPIMTQPNNWSRAPQNARCAACVEPHSIFTGYGWMIRCKNALAAPPHTQTVGKRKKYGSKLKLSSQVVGDQCAFLRL